MFQRLFVLHWQDYKCKWSRYFCYFSIILFSLFTAILIYRVHVWMWLKPGMSHLVLAGCSGPRDLTLDHTIWKIYRKKVFSVWWLCLGETWIKGGFPFTIVSGVGLGGVVKYCSNWYRSNFSLPNKFVIPPPVWPSSLDRNVVAFLYLLPQRGRHCAEPKCWYPSARLQCHNL